MSKVPVSNQDRQKSYFKYYLNDLAPVPPGSEERINRGPLDNSSALRIEDRNDLFKPGYLAEEAGVWQLEDGTVVVANHSFFPGVTGEMFDWWFTWHPIDRLRYAIWNPEDHYDSKLEDPAKALDISIPVRERNWDAVHYVWEDIGAGSDLIRISFKRPAAMGYDESQIGTEACSSLICANGITYGNEHRPDAPAVMTHFLRPVEDGSELRSRFWFGWHIIDGKPVKLVPDGIKIPVEVGTALLAHNIKEYTNLGVILPQIYAEEKDNWIDSPSRIDAA